MSPPPHRYPGPVWRRHGARRRPRALRRFGLGRWSKLFVEAHLPGWGLEVTALEFLPNLYLHAYETPTDLGRALSRYLDFYNAKRHHSALDRRTPDAVYFEQADRDLAA